MSIGDDQLHAGKTAPNKVLKEVGPEDLRFRGADMQADDLAPALGVDGHGDYCGNADDPPAFAYLEIGGWSRRHAPYRLAAVGFVSPLAEPDVRLSLRIRLSRRHGEVRRPHPAKAIAAHRGPTEQMLLGQPVTP
ncbi:hypothetical protein SAMN06295937_10693 [Sphingopyxis flava]|uniref:Uncharacterized protein n=1 Tax=Sphingopyxis flava TaxID=1507287 RepID=A0A1T5GCK7_9SPHN|nr:hypothetical protein SAMN06295937_10693 [Sphingopyxis flava]